MAVRKIVRIDEDRCTGCGECVPACAEGAIQIVDGKAKLMAENLCDGLGACLGDCPENAITIEEREAGDFDEVAVSQHLAAMEAGSTQPIVPKRPLTHAHDHLGCPSARVINFDRPSSDQPADGSSLVSGVTQLRQWPIQLHLVPPTAPFFKDADVLLAADCVSFAVGDFHDRHLKGKALAIACPKLDQGMDIYLEKLVAMIDLARINTLTVMVMEVPCCLGLVQLAREAVSRAERNVPIRFVKIGLRGAIVADEWLAGDEVTGRGAISSM